MNYIKKEYLRLIKEIKEIFRRPNGEKYRNEDIAKDLGYNRSYFSQLLGENGNITEDHLNHLKLYHQKMLAYLTRIGQPVLEAKKPEHKKEPPQQEDFQAKYMALLEEHLEMKKALSQELSILRDKVDTLQEKLAERISSKLTEVDDALDEVMRAQQIMYALQNAYYDFFLGRIENKEDARQTIVEDAASRLGMIHENGIQL